MVFEILRVVEVVLQAVSPGHALAESLAQQQVEMVVCGFVLVHRHFPEGILG